MSGQLSHEVEVNVPVCKAWELYGTLKLSKLVEQEFKTLFNKIELVEGDGGVGTILNLVFAPGTGFTTCKEKFTKIDNEKHVKEVELVEGGYLEMGFTLYRVRLEIIEKGEDSCIIKSTIEYDVKEEGAANNAPIVTIEPFANIAEMAKNYLIKNKA